MSNQKLIFVCGPDMTGKTEIAHELSRRLCIPYFKATSEHTTFLSTEVEREQQFLNQLRFADPRVLDVLTQTGHSMVFDRGYPCEWVYSSIMGRETDHVMLRYLDEQYAKLGAMIVFCHRSSYDGIYDDLDPSIDPIMLTKIDRLYRSFLGTTKCKKLYLNVDDEDLDREVKEIENFLHEQRTESADDVPSGD